MEVLELSVLKFQSSLLVQYPLWSARNDAWVRHSPVEAYALMTPTVPAPSPIKNL